MNKPKSYTSFELKKIGAVRITAPTALYCRAV